MSDIRELLAPELPPILFRNNPKFKDLTGFSSRTLANADADGTGPEERIFSGRVCGYPKEALLRWLEAKSWTVPKKNITNVSSKFSEKREG